MKRWQKITLALLLAVTVWMAEGFWIVGTADCVVRVSFTGLNNIFHIPFEYYAVRGGDAARVPGWVMLFAGSDAITGSKYDDEVTTQWFVELIYMPRVELFDSGEFLGRHYSWLPTDFSESHRVYYHRWAGPKRNPDDETLAVMRQAAQTLHSGSRNTWSSMVNATGERTLTWFIFVSNGDSLLVQHREGGLYLPMEDGTFQLLMECPQGGQFDYYWFP